MDETLVTLAGRSDNSLENINTTQVNDIPVTIDNNLFVPHADNTLFEQEQFCYNLATEYLSTLPSFSQHSLDQALSESLFHSTDPRPLALYIHDNQSLSTQIFYETVLCSQSISAYLAEQYIVWSWNVTKENYYDLLSTVTTHTGEAVGVVIDSSPNDLYPLLICLTFDRGQIKVESVIQGIPSECEVFDLLIQARDAFSSRFELPDMSGLSLTTISMENWCIPASTLTEVLKESDEFRRVASDFDGGAPSIVHIHRIDNTVWLMEYLNQKQLVDTRVDHDNAEKLLFHGCPYAAAEQILQKGFDHDRIGRHGTSYGHGFYFSSSRLVSDRYARPHESTGEKRILMCRVLIGRSCQGDQMMRRCPSNYDSTSGKSNIHVVYSNRHVLPEYLITYK